MGGEGARSRDGVRSGQQGERVEAQLLLLLLLLRSSSLPLLLVLVLLSRCRTGAPLLSRLYMISEALAGMDLE